ncbi:hypothetical protein ACHAWF_017303 [Thalassiosira exigua]
MRNLLPQGTHGVAPPLLLWLLLPSDASGFASFGGGAATRRVHLGGRGRPASSPAAGPRRLGARRRVGGVEAFPRPPPSVALLARGRRDGGDDDDAPGEDDDGRRRPFVDDGLDAFGLPKNKKKRPPFFEEWDEGDVRGPDRIRSCIPYALPLIDGHDFGNYLYDRVPPLGALDYVTLRPIVEGFRAVPGLAILLFVAFALGPQFAGKSREVRFNAQQAVLIDVLLIFPQLIGEAVAEADAKLPREVMEPCSNFVWIAHVSVVMYCVVSNLRGKMPDQIPFLSAAANFAIGPF